MKVSPELKLSNSGQSKVSISGEVLSCLPIMQMKKQQTKSMTNNFMEIVNNSYSSNSDKNEGSDFCNECKVYYYIMKQECD